MTDLSKTACGCPPHSSGNGDIRCHNCGEYVNKQCWKCKTPRGEGVCPNPVTTSVGKFAPPPLRKDHALFWTMAVRDGQLYAAPLGTPLSFDNPDAWIPIDSLEYLRAMFGVTA